MQGSQHLEVWVPMESPKGLAMEGSSVIKKKKKMTKSGKFIVKSPYNILELDNYGSFLMSGIWLSWIQPRVSVFAWEAVWGKVLTLDQV